MPTIGIVVVTASKALLWTDGRYHLQAKAQLDHNWTLMKAGLPDTPSLEAWLVKVNKIILLTISNNLTYDHVMCTLCNALQHKTLTV